jgi:soluble lytic murein transglycosylase-like protein
MAGRSRLVAGGICAILVATTYAGEAGARAPEEIPLLEARMREQDAMLEAEIEEISAVGSELEEAQVRVDDVRARSQELERQARSLNAQLESQREAYAAARARYEERAEAAYRGDEVEGLLSILDGLLGSTQGFGVLADGRMVEILLQGREDLESYAESEQLLENTLRQISEKERAFIDAREEERARAEELRRREDALEASVERIRSDRARLEELEAEERARILRQRSATGSEDAQLQQELSIAREDIVARPVEQISKERYKKLYRKSAREYGFGEDWYILAAVGKVESNHGENMGPSSAGAMGPMQFLPSTWQTSGVDGNGDGEANIMDPRDAIPAAARYLRAGGAPEDWYAALYSYNHADWYVKKVLGVAEGYRRLAKDDSVGPYV